MLKSQLNIILFFLKDKRKKNIFKLIKEFIILFFLKKEIPFYYLKYAYRKSVTNYKDYLSSKETKSIVFSDKLHDPELISIISNKLTFSLFCKEKNLKVPKLLSYNLKNEFIFQNQKVKINNIKELNKQFLLALNENNKEEIFIKPLSLHGGIGCIKISKKSLNTDLQKWGNYILENSFIHEEVIKQHPKINHIHSHCINTLRIETYIDKNKDKHVLSAFMRFGVDESLVDNAHNGGFFIGIDMKNNQLKKFGHQYIKYGGAELTKHPNSKYILEGFVVPYFKEACELVIKALEFIPNRYIGWDVAISENGPVIIEANEYPAIFMTDVAHGGYLKNPLIKDIIKEVSK